MGYNNTKPRCIIAPKDYHIVGSAQNGTKMAASWGTNSIKIHAKKGLQGATWVMQTVKLFWICRCFRHLVTASLQEVALLKLPLNQSYQKLEDISLSMTFFHWSHGAKDKDISRWRNSRRLLGYYYIIILLYHYITILLYYHITILLYYYITILLY